MQSSVEIEEIAAAWFAKRGCSDWSEADQAELDQWLGASTANRVAFIRLEAAWRETHRLKALAAGVPSGEVPKVGAWWSASSASDKTALLAPSSKRTITRSRVARALAATLVTIAAGGAIWFTIATGGDSYRTVVGGMQSLPLSDGSQVTLNTNTSIRVAVSRSERRVELDQGEAFFEVAEDRTRPFVVVAGERRVVAVGTKFSVLRNGNDLRVVVTEGRVRVEPEESPRLIEAGNIAWTNKTAVLVQPKPLPEVEEYLSWRSGFVVFHDTPLDEAIAELNRYNSRKLVIADPAIGVIRIGGHFRATNVDAFARLLEDGFPIVIERRTDGIVLSAAKVP